MVFRPVGRSAAPLCHEQSDDRLTVWGSREGAPRHGNEFYCPVRATNAAKRRLFCYGLWPSAWV